MCIYKKHINKKGLDFGNSSLKGNELTLTWGMQETAAGVQHVNSELGKRAESEEQDHFR